MKNIIILLSFLISSICSFAQYPKGEQTIGVDSNVVKAKGGFMARFIPYVYFDTTAANLERIRQYPGAEIYTSSDQKKWYRNQNADTWLDWTVQRFGVEDNLGTANRTFDALGFNFRYLNGNWGFKTTPSQTLSIGDDISGTSTLSLYAPDGTSSFIESSNGASIGISAGSFINLRPSWLSATSGQIVIFPTPSGYVSQSFYSAQQNRLGEIGVNVLDLVDTTFEFFFRPIDVATNQSELVFYGPKRFPETEQITDTTGFDVGMINRTNGKFRLIPSNLIGSATTWNNIINPTGNQTLSWDDGELNDWTVSSNTETFHTVTANSLTTGIGELMTLNGLTTGNGISITTNSTAKAAGNALFNGTSTGANGTATTTSVIYNGSNTNTGSTSTNVVYNGNASGATNNWTFRAETGNFRSTGAAGFYALSAAGTGGISMAYDNGTIGTLTTTGGVRLDLDAASSTILARRPFIVGIGIDFGNAVALDVYKSASGTSNIQNWRSSGGTVLASVNQSGRFFIGSTTSATALLHLAAGTTAASTAPLKFTSGTNLTTPEDGAVEYDGANFFGTASTTRYTFAKTLTNTATLDFADTAPSTSTDLTITVTGAADGDAVSIGVPNGSTAANSSYTAWVSSANTVTVRFFNIQTVGNINPASGSFRASVIKY